MDKHQTFVIEDDNCTPKYKDALINADCERYRAINGSRCRPTGWNLVTVKEGDGEEDVYVAMWTRYDNVALFHGSREDQISDSQVSAIESYMIDRFDEWIPYPCSPETLTLFSIFAQSGFELCGEEHEAFMQSMQHDMSKFDCAVSDNLTIYAKG